MALRFLRPGEGLPIPKPSGVKKAPSVDKSVLAFGEPERLRDEPYRKSFAERFCLICGKPALPCHIPQGHEGGKGLKASSNLMLPFCHECHSAMDLSGNHALWLLENLIKPMARRMHTEWVKDRVLLWRTGFKLTAYRKQKSKFPAAAETQGV